MTWLLPIAVSGVALLQYSRGVDLVPNRPFGPCPPNGSIRPRPCKNSNTRAAVYEFQSVFGIFGHYRPGRAKKFAPDAPFSDNFRVFTRSGPRAAARFIRQQWSVMGHKAEVN